LLIGQLYKELWLGRSLSRRPAARAAAQQVYVEMIHGLAAVRAGVDDHPIALGEALGAGNLGDGPEQVAEESAVTLFALGQRDDVLAGSDQHMYRRLRMKVREGVALIVLVDGGRGYASVNDLAKEATHGETSVQERDSLVCENKTLWAKLAEW
jgi:hypothetical protein